MIYLDNHATTPLDPSSLAAMLPSLQDQFANPGSTTHAPGRHMAEMVDQAIAGLGELLGASSEEIVVTSGATESNNLALFGSCLHPRQTRRKVISLVTEHKAILDPLARLSQMGFEIQLLPVQGHDSLEPGRADLQRLIEAIDDQTAMVSVMLANNEVGTIQPMAEIAAACRRFGCLLHSDATQAVGRIPVDVDDLDVDLLSFSAHKFYGPKGVGGLFVRRRGRRTRLQAQIVGGGQQHNFRSGTLNSTGILGMHAALRACHQTLAADRLRIAGLRDRLFDRLQNDITHLRLNGPALTPSDGPDAVRLAGNLNCCFYPIEGQSLMLATPELAVSSGSACTSVNPSPSHVLQAIGLSEDEARSSIRFGVGRFNTADEIERAADWLSEAARSLGRLI